MGHRTSYSNMAMLISGVLIIVMIAASRPVAAWDCVCNPSECEALEPSGCPGLGVIVWDPCRCCKVCSRTLGETCGGFSGTCEPGLICDNGICSDSATKHGNTGHHHHHHHSHHDDNNDLS